VCGGEQAAEFAEERSGLLERLRDVGSALLDERDALWRQPNDVAPIDLCARDQTPVIRFFPNGQSRARGAPRVHHFVVGPIAERKPFQKIEDQRFWCRVTHESQTGLASKMLTIDVVGVMD